MASSSSLVFFLTLVCLAAGGPLPLKAGTSMESLLNASLTLWEGLPQSTDLLDQVDSSLSSWSGVFAGAVEDTMRLMILDPFTMAYNEAFTSTDELEDEQPSLDGNFAVLLEDESFLDYFSKVIEDPINELYQDMNATRNAISDIVADLPNWMDTNGLLKVDLSKVDFNGRGLFEVLVSNTNVPEYQQKNFQQIQTTVNALPSRAAAMGQNAAKSVKKMLTYLKTEYPVTALFLP